MHLVIADVVPIACPAGKAAGIPVVCVTNFSWDFVYSEYLTAAGGKYRQMVWQIANDYSKAQLCLRLPGYVPMPAFRDVVDVPLVVRTARRSKEEVRRAYNVPDGARLLLLCFGRVPNYRCKSHIYQKAGTALFVPAQRQRLCRIVSSFPQRMSIYRIF